MHSARRVAGCPCWPEGRRAPSPGATEGKWYVTKYRRLLYIFRPPRSATGTQKSGRIPHIHPLRTPTSRHCSSDIPAPLDVIPIFSNSGISSRFGVASLTFLFRILPLNCHSIPFLAGFYSKDIILELSLLDEINLISLIILFLSFNLPCNCFFCWRNTFWSRFCHIY